MSSNPIDHLLAEHKHIMGQVAELRTAVVKLDEQGEEALPQVLPIFERVGQMMATELDLHRRKEDDVFFPVLEAIIGEEGPTAVMRQEHRDIHQQGVLLRETLHELNEVEHPAIEAGRQQLQQLTAAGGSAAALQETAAEIIRLLDLHFGKEEQILFPMARNMLSVAQLAQVMERFEQLASA